MAPSHYLNQCWNIVNWTPRDKLQWKLNRNSNIVIHENLIESIVCEMAAILSRPQCVNIKHPSWCRDFHYEKKMVSWSSYHANTAKMAALYWNDHLHFHVLWELTLIAFMGIKGTCNLFPFDHSHKWMACLECLCVYWSFCSKRACTHKWNQPSVTLAMTRCLTWKDWSRFNP